MHQYHDVQIAFFSDSPDFHWCNANRQPPYNQFNNLKELCVSVRNSYIFSNLITAIKQCNLETLHVNLWTLLRNGDHFSNCSTFVKHILETKNKLSYVSITGDNGTILRALCEYFGALLARNDENAVSLHLNDRQDIENGIFDLINIISKSVTGNMMKRITLNV